MKAVAITRQQFLSVVPTPENGQFLIIPSWQGGSERFVHAKLNEVVAQAVQKVDIYESVLLTVQYVKEEGSNQPIGMLYGGHFWMPVCPVRDVEKLWKQADEALAGIPASTPAPPPKIIATKKVTTNDTEDLF